MFLLLENKKEKIRKKRELNIDLKILVIKEKEENNEDEKSNKYI